jgi:hypothetical protein
MRRQRQTRSIELGTGTRRGVRAFSAMETPRSAGDDAPLLHGSATVEPRRSPFTRCGRRRRLRSRVLASDARRAARWQGDFGSCGRLHRETAAAPLLDLRLGLATAKLGEATAARSVTGEGDHVPRGDRREESCGEASIYIEASWRTS